MYGNFFKEVTLLYQLKYFSWSCLRIFFRSQSSRMVNNDYILANFYYTARLTYAPQEWWEGVHLHTFLLWYFQHHYKVRKTPVLVTVRYKHPIKKLFTSHISVRLVPYMNYIIIHNFCTLTVSLLINLGHLRLMSRLKQKLQGICWVVVTNSIISFIFPLDG